MKKKKKKKKKTAGRVLERFAVALEHELRRLQTWPDSTDEDLATARAVEASVQACIDAARKAAKP